MNSCKRILIAGGSGFIGKQLTQLFIQNGLEVHILSRTKKAVSGAQTFYWSTESNLIDDACLEGVDAIINLAGDGIVDRPWSDKRKTEIYNSRINATKLLFDLVYKHKNQVTAYIGASAIGVYPEGINLTENTLPADTFLAKLCHQWELEHLMFEQRGIRTCIVRIGLVMSPQGGMLKEILKPFKFFIAPVFGNGNQWQSWISINDLCGLFFYLLSNNQLNGIYNGVAPCPLMAKDMIQQIRNSQKMPGVLVHIPSGVLKLMMGERAEMLLANQKVMSDKVQATGYCFINPDFSSIFQQE